MVIIYIVLDMHPFGISKTKVLKAGVYMASAFLFALLTFCRSYSIMGITKYIAEHKNIEE